MFTEKLTDPHQHDENNFVYIVHGLIDQLNSFQDVPSLHATQKIDRIKDPTQFYRASMIGKLEADVAKETIGWHGGAVSQIGTYGTEGFIVRPKNNDVHVAWYSDLGSPVDPDGLRQFATYNAGKKKSPRTLLTRTVDRDGIGYNEMIIRGNERAEIQGVFYRTDREPRALVDAVSEALQQDVPLVRLPEFDPKTSESETDPEQRELLITLKAMQAQSEIMLAHEEFRNAHRIDSEQFRHFSYDSLKK